jgi:hypothetical protein
MLLNTLLNKTSMKKQLLLLAILTLSLAAVVQGQTYDITIGDPGTAAVGAIKLNELPASGTNYVGLGAPTTLAGDILFTLPSLFPTTSGDVLTSTTAGVMSWTNPASLGVKWNALTDPDGALTLSHGTHATTFNFANTTTTGFAMNATALSSGILLSLNSSNTASTGNALLVSSNSTGASANGIVRYNFTGAHTNNGFQIDDATTAGTAMVANATALTTGKALSITAGGATALTTGNALLVTGPSGAAALSNAAGGVVNFTAAGNYTSTNNAGLLNLNANATTAGIIQNISGNALTTGTALNITSTGAYTGANGIFAVTANSATTGTVAKISSNGLTSGTGLSVTSSGASLNSTNGLFYVANTGATSNGILARMQSNSTAGSGLTVRTDGNVGIGIITPATKLDVIGGARFGGRNYFSKTVGVSNTVFVELTNQSGAALSTTSAYSVKLVTTGTGTDTGAEYLVWYDATLAAWQVRAVSLSGTNSNHPALFIDAGVVKIRNYHASTYNTNIFVEEIEAGIADVTGHIIGTHYNWQRTAANLSYTDGSVGVGIASPYATFTNGGSTAFGTLALTNFAANAAIGTAAATVDIYTAININQTTASITLTLPNPTTATAGRIVKISNVGTVAFTVGGVTIGASQATEFFWNGSAWVAEVGGSSPSLTVPISGLLAATGTNTIDNTTLAQTWNWTTATTQNPLSLSAAALTTGKAFSITAGGATALTTGNALLVTGPSGAAALSNAAGGVVNFTAAGNYTSANNAGLLNLNANATTAGIIQNISGNALTTGTALNIASTGVYTGANGILAVTANSATTGNVINISSNGLTTGNALNISATGTVGNGSKLLNLTRSGTNGAAAMTNYGVFSSITNTNATSATNIAGYFNASGASPAANYAIIVPASGGDVGIGTSTPINLTPSSTTTIVHLHDAGTSATDFGQFNISSATTASGNRTGVINFAATAATSERRSAVIESYLTAASGTNASGDLRFSTSNAAAPTEKMRIASNGNVGIGVTVNPTALLSVGDWNSGSAGTTTGNQVSIGGLHNAGVNLGGKKLYINSYDNDGSVVYPIYLEDENNLIDYWIQNRPTAASVPTMFFAGNVGIATAPSATYRLEVNGKLKSAGIDENSDIRLKKDINTITDALRKVMEMRGVTYNWRKDEFPERSMEDDLQYGLIAQELEKVIPELVTADDQGWKSIEYSHLVPVLIEAIKELDAKNNAQKAELDKQTKTNEELKASIESLLIRMNAVENSVEVKTNKAEK